MTATLAIWACVLGKAAAPAVAERVPSQPASGFRDSVGVNLHSTFSGLAGDQTSVGTLKYMLRTLGVWHVRDSVCLARDAECVRPRTRLSQLSSALGPEQPKVDLLLGVSTELDIHPDRALRDSDLQGALTAVSTPPLAGHVAALEETNEPDLQKVKDWPTRTLADHATLARLLADPKYASLSGIPLVGPSMGHPNSTPNLLAGGWTTALGDIRNFHPYPPAWGGPENAMGVRCTTNVSVLGCVDLLGPSKPWATEAGYPTIGSPAAGTWVSRQAQTIYLPRLLLDNYAKGVARTYLYELIDRSPDPTSDTNGWGLWRAKFKSLTQIVSGSAKPAAWAIGRLNARIGDVGGASTTGALDLSIKDVNGHTAAGTSLRRVLLRRADGTYALALWQPRTVYTTAASKQRTIAVPSLRYTVQVNDRNGWTATAFRPTYDDLAVQSRGTSSITVPVGADVTLIDLRPGDATTPIPGGDPQLRRGDA